MEDIIGCSVETSDIGYNVETEMNEPEPKDDPDDDRIHEMVHDLYTAEDHGPATNSKFATILEEMKQQLQPDGPYTRFSFVVKLLHIKSFYRICNVAFNAFLKLLSVQFPKCSIPASYCYYSIYLLDYYSLNTICSFVCLQVQTTWTFYSPATENMHLLIIFGTSELGGVCGC